jgi:hypothetical protein
MDPDPGGPKIYGSDGSGSATLLKILVLLWSGIYAFLLDHGAPILLATKFGTAEFMLPKNR